MKALGPIRFSQRRKPLSVPLLMAITLLHVLLLYGLARLLAPDLTASVQRTVVSAFTISPSPAAPPPPEPDLVEQGAAGDAGRQAVPKPVTAPKPKVVVREQLPAPTAASTGAASRSGAAEAGEGTGLSGSGEGTGSGTAGAGRGGGLATKPVHISGEINNARDYPVPPGGRQARQGTEVIVRVTVGVDGRARGCTIFRASPDPDADQRTCELVEARLGFRPARDAAGNPVAAPFYWRQRWF